MKADIDPGAVPGDWVRSSEEDTATEVVYRRSSYPFPPSRGREALRLSADGTMIRAAVGATDLHRHGQGRWRLQDGILHLEFDGNEDASRALDLVEASPERLAVKR